MKLYSVKYYGNLTVYADTEAEARENFYCNALELIQATEIDSVELLPEEDWK
jgi:hypothetical protein